MAVLTSAAAVEYADEREMRRLVRKVDVALLPVLCVCYAFFYIDKTTLSYAAIFGIKKDLHLQGTQYSWLSSVFYFGFLAWAFPTNLLMQRLPIGRYLSANIFAWGALLMLQAVSKSFSALAALRALSGAAESCFDPSVMLIIGMWYTRKEQPIRIGVWYAANGFGIAVGGLLGYGIGQIKGALPSWKYEFLIVGAACAAWGIVMFILLPDSPVTASFLTERERVLVVSHLRENQTGIENKHFKWYQVREAFLDYKLYLMFFIGLVSNIPNGGISNFGTIIIQGFGFSTLVTTLMQIPYGAIISFAILSCVYLNDRFANRRCCFVLLYMVPTIAGAFGLHFVPARHQIARLICYYLTGFYNASFVLFLSLQVANTAGHTKKVVINAALFLGYCTGNIAGPFFYHESQAYVGTGGIPSKGMLLGVLLKWENTRRDHLLAAEQDGADTRDLDATAFADLTDRENLNFRYIY
ncbi:hypothetical protein KEM52_003073 [Ascosphaera acerosa]|nr:hypothetical protein KEM52_003073 [Ascosphaera acerosa]